MTIGENIKAARKKAGLTQKGLADKLGIPYQGISQYERGIRKPKLETLDRIATALGVSLETLLDGVNFENSEKEHLSREQISRTISSITKVIFSGTEREKQTEELFEKLKNSMFYGIEEEIGFSTIDNMKRLNIAGQKKALNYLTDLAKIPEYQKNYQAAENMEGTEKSLSEETISPSQEKPLAQPQTDKDTPKQVNKE